MNKNILITLVLIIAAVGAYIWFGDKGGLPMMQRVENTDGGVKAPPTAKHTVTWKFESMGEDPAIHAEKTKVTVTWDGSSHDAGTYQGTCAEIDGSNGTLQDGEVSGALCWFAGAGDEIGVFEENGGFVLKHGEQQEPSGEGSAFRGNFKTLITL